MILLSITGVFKVVAIIIGVAIVLKVVGQFLVARRNMEAERDLLQKDREEKEAMAKHQKTFGQTTVSRVDKNDGKSENFSDYEEVKP